MRYPLLTLLFLFTITTGLGFCLETDPDVIIFTPPNVKNQALEETLQYGHELILRQDLGQATKLFKHVIALDPCNPQAREELKMIADRGYQKKVINDYLAGLNCEEKPAPQAVSMEPEKTVAALPMTALPNKVETRATAPVLPQTTPLQGATLEDKLADLQKKIQRIETNARDQNNRLNALTNRSSTSQN